MSWTDEQLRRFDALPDRLVAEQQSESGTTWGDGYIDGHRSLPGNVRPLRPASSSTRNGKLEQHGEVLRGYLHQDDDGHVLFALVVAVSA